jgi:type VI secretion system secreted protein VgrG
VPAFSQENSPLRVLTPLGDDTLLAVRLEGTETLGGSFRFSLDLVAALGSTVPFPSLVGNAVSAGVSMPGGASRWYHGIVTELTLLDSDGVLDHYRMTLEPRLAELGLVKRSRIFQNATATDIIRQVLGPVGGADIRLTGSPPVRVTCSQYRETDLEFFLRLCSEEGFIHYWNHTRDNHQLVITDTTSENPSSGAVPYDLTVGGTGETTFIRSWALTQSRAPLGSQVGGSHMQVYGKSLDSSANGPASVSAASIQLKPSGNPGPWEEDGQSTTRFFDAVNASGGEDTTAIGNMYSAQERQAGIVSAAAASGSVRARAVGNCCQLTAGLAMTLSGHPTQSGDWLAVSVSHKVEVEGRYWAGEAATLTRNIVAELAPLELSQAHWPPKARPRVGGVCTATVVGPPPMNVDQYGRVQVAFPWDRNAPGQIAAAVDSEISSSNGSSQAAGSAATTGQSCWVRVAQSWAGNGWGSCFWPRVGHEVVVAFEEGDPDRPVIVGSVYNCVNMPPYALPDNMYIAGWKSLTQGGDPTVNFHQILMSDESSAPVVAIHSESIFVSNQENQQKLLRPKYDFDFQGG